MVRKQQKQRGNIRKPQESSGSYKIKLTRLIQFLKKVGQGGGNGKEVQALQEGTGQAAKQRSVWPRSTETDCYLNRQTIAAVGRLHPATGGGG